MTESVRSLKTKASFQKGLMPTGSMDWKASVTAQMSIMVKIMERTMARSMTAKRGEMYISSKKPKLYRVRML